MFIDDAVQVNIPIGETEPEKQANVANQRSLRQAIYGANCLKESADKNYESDSLAIITGDKIYKGEPLRQGLKAASGFAAYDPVPVETWGTRTNNFFACAQGVATSGGNLEWATWMYIWRSTLYGEIMAPGSLASMDVLPCGILMVTPMRLGGLGIVGSLGIDSNAAGPSSAMGLAILTGLAISSESLSTSINNVLNQPLTRIDDLDWMRDPGQYMVEGPRIRTMRVKSACIEAAMKKASNPTLLDLIKDSRRIDMTRLASRLRMQPSVSRDKIKQFWNSSSLAKTESILGKFQNCDDIFDLLPSSRVYSLRRMGRVDLYAVVDAWFYRMEGSAIPTSVRSNNDTSDYDLYE